MTSIRFTFDNVKYNFTNTYERDMPEYTLYNNLLKGIHQMLSTLDENWFGEQLLFEIDCCIAKTVSKAFIKMSIESNDVHDFSISEYEHRIYEALHDQDPDKQSQRY